MTERSEYYLNYVGPNLTSCTFDGKDFTDKAIENYGPMNNWYGMLYTHKEFFGENSQGKKFRFDFKSDNGRTHWFHGWVDDENQILNMPLATPMCQRTV